MGIQPVARFPARSADAWPATLYGLFTQAIYLSRPIEAPAQRQTLSDLAAKHEAEMEVAVAAAADRAARLKWKKVTASCKVTEKVGSVNGYTGSLKRESGAHSRGLTCP
jgi:hypothetical protein